MRPMFPIKFSESVHLHYDLNRINKAIFNSRKENGAQAFGKKKKKRLQKYKILDYFNRSVTKKMCRALLDFIHKVLVNQSSWRSLQKCKINVVNFSISNNNTYFKLS